MLTYQQLPVSTLVTNSDSKQKSSSGTSPQEDRAPDSQANKANRTSKVQRFSA